MIFICRCNKHLLECISQSAAGKCLYDRLKLFPGLLSPPRHPGWRINGRVATSHSSKQSCLFLNQFSFHQIFILYIFILNILCHHHLVLLFLFHMVLKVEFIIHTQQHFISTISGTDTVRSLQEQQSHVQERYGLYQLIQETSLEIYQLRFRTLKLW